MLMERGGVLVRARGLFVSVREGARGLLKKEARALLAVIAKAALDPLPSSSKQALTLGAINP